MNNSAPNVITVEVSEKLASVLQSNGSIWTTIAPYAIGASSVLVSIIIGFVTYKTAIKSVKTQNEIAKENLASLEKSRYIETIGKERSKWISNVRESFTEFNSKCHEYALKHTHVDLKNMTSTDIKELFQIISDLRLLAYKVILFLNPKERLTIALEKKMDELIHYLIECYDKRKYIDGKVFEQQILREILYLQNVILKSEWHRLKKEVKDGEIDSTGMDTIYDKVAKSIDEELFSKLIK